MEAEVSTPGTSEDAFDEFSDENADFPEEETTETEPSVIREIQEANAVCASKTNGTVTKSDSFSSDKSKEFDSSADHLNENVEEDLLHDKEWLMQKKHVFILSSAGKPIYSLHGSEEKLVTLFGVMQALVSFVQSGQDNITSIHAAGIKFVFLVRNSLILVAASRSNLSVHQLQMQLTDVYNQILSILTLTHMTKIFEKRRNFDLRRLLAGSERLIDHLLVNDSSNKRISNNIFTFLTNSIRIMPLSTTNRNNITNAIQSNCSKIKNLVFAVLIASNKLIALVRMKKYFLHPADLRLLFNLIECTESFKVAESWTPICLPKFDCKRYFHAHVSYFAEDCEACLVLLSVDPSVFFTLSEAKKKITERMRRTHCMAAIKEEINNRGVNLSTIGIPEIRHFLYKPKNCSQMLCSEIISPYNTLKEFERLEAIYCDMHHRVHNSLRPLKLIYEVKEKEVILAWVTASSELYAVFEPTVEKSLVIKLVDKLLRWIDKEQEILFIKNHPTF